MRPSEVCTVDQVATCEKGPTILPLPAANFGIFILVFSAQASSRTTAFVVLARIRSVCDTIVKLAIGFPHVEVQGTHAPH